MVEETNNLYYMIQRFIDEHATDRIKQLRSSEVNLKDKMNIMMNPENLESGILGFLSALWIYMTPRSPMRSRA